MPDSCVPSNSDVMDWPHLKGMDLSKISEADVGLIIGLKENPRLLIPFEYRAGSKSEPVAVRYSLGWTVIGLMNGKRSADGCSMNRVNLANE